MTEEVVPANLVLSRQGMGKSPGPRLLRRMLPRNNLGDALYAWLHYSFKQRRLPGRRGSGRLSDRIFWMKFDGTLLDPLRQFVSDKEYVKHYIAGVVGQQYTVETYQVLRSFREVERMQLTRFPSVVKPVHMSGQLLICHGSLEPLNKELVKEWMRRDYYLESREQNYKYLKPGILIEEFIAEDARTVPDDYKVFCFEGEPGFIQVDSGRFGKPTRNLYDSAWNRLPWTIHLPPRVENDPRPEQLGEILEIATRLSAPFSFVRVDMYVSGERIKVGELTNCPGSAGVHIRPASGEYALNSAKLQGRVSAA